jgi:hypothetical protein
MYFVLQAYSKNFPVNCCFCGMNRGKGCIKELVQDRSAPDNEQMF